MPCVWEKHLNMRSGERVSNLSILPSRILKTGEWPRGCGTSRTVPSSREDDVWSGGHRVVRSRAASRVDVDWQGTDFPGGLPDGCSLVTI